jgi:hypothetical protein
MSAGTPGGRVVPGELDQVGAVDARRPDPDPDLPGARLGIGVLADLEATVDDGGGEHQADGCRRRVVVMVAAYGQRC